MTGVQTCALPISALERDEVVDHKARAGSRCSASRRTSVLALEGATLGGVAMGLALVRAAMGPAAPGAVGPAGPGAVRPTALGAVGAAAPGAVRPAGARAASPAGARGVSPAAPGAASPAAVRAMRVSRGAGGAAAMAASLRAV